MFSLRKEKLSKKEEIQRIIEVLSELEPKHIDRVAAFAKEHRAYMQKIDAFLSVENNKSNKEEIDFIEQEEIG